MAHNLHIENEKASLFYVGVTPWHKLGTKLDSPATASQAIKAANLNWRVTKIPMFGIINSSVIPSKKFGIAREDKIGKPDCEIFGVVSDQYVPLQNSEAFDFFDNIVGNGEAIYHTAGALGKGDKIWILAKLPEDIVVKGVDIVEKFLLLSNGHDGLTSVQIKFTPIRVICQNTLNLAMSSGSKPLAVSHLKSLPDKLAAAAELLGIIRTSYEEISGLFDKMAKTHLSDEDAEAYINSIFPLPQQSNSKDSEGKTKRVLSNRAESLHYFKTGKGNDQDQIKGTLWAAYNGVTEYIDYHKKLRNTTDRTNYLLFGEGSAIKERALNVARELVTT
jgi:phage/plasmid-like protein (TIGR03299 family)